MPIKSKNKQRMDISCNNERKMLRELSGLSSLNEIRDKLQNYLQSNEPCMRIPVSGYSTYSSTRDDCGIPCSGDFNQGGSIDVLDVIQMASIVSGVGPHVGTNCSLPGDVNNDGQLDILDIVTMINRIFDGGTPFDGCADGEIILCSDDEIYIPRNHIPELDSHRWGSWIMDTPYQSNQSNGYCFFKTDLDFLGILYGNYLPYIDGDIDFSDTSTLTSLLKVGNQSWAGGRLLTLNCNPEGDDGYYKPCGMSLNADNEAQIDLSNSEFDSLSSHLILNSLNFSNPNIHNKYQCPMEQGNVISDNTYCLDVGIPSLDCEYVGQYIIDATVQLCDRVCAGDLETECAQLGIDCSDGSECISAPQEVVGYHQPFRLPGWNASNLIENYGDSFMELLPEIYSLDLSETTKVVDESETQLSVLNPLTIGDNISTLNGNLKNLNLNSTQLSYITNLGMLSELQQLRLNDNNISELSDVGYLYNLKQLYLNNNSLESIFDEISGMVNLQYLMVSDNQLDGVIPDSIGSLSSLISLVGNNNNITGISDQLWNLPELSTVELYSNNISTIPEFSENSNLNKLWLADNQITELPESICNIPAADDPLSTGNSTPIQLWGNKICDVELIPSCLPPSSNNDFWMSHTHGTPIWNQYCPDTNIGNEENTIWLDFIGNDTWVVRYNSDSQIGGIQMTLDFNEDSGETISIIDVETSYGFLSSTFNSIIIAFSLEGESYPTSSVGDNSELLRFTIIGCGLESPQDCIIGIHEINIADQNGDTLNIVYDDGQYCDDTGACNYGGNNQCWYPPVKFGCTCENTNIQMYYLDDDGDGLGCNDTGVEACAQPPDYVGNDDDDYCNCTSDIVDCFGICNGNETEDHCGVCGGESNNVESNDPGGQCACPDGNKIYFDDCGICGGDNICDGTILTDGSCNYGWNGSDFDNCGVCGGDNSSCAEISGCMDMSACNYDEYATVDSGYCEYAEGYYDCDGVCWVGFDCDNVCGGTAVIDLDGMCCTSGYIDDCGICKPLPPCVFNVELGPELAGLHPNPDVMHSSNLSGESNCCFDIDGFDVPGAPPYGWMHHSLFYDAIITLEGLDTDQDGMPDVGTQFSDESIWINSNNRYTTPPHILDVTFDPHCCGGFNPWSYPVGTVNNILDTLLIPGEMYFATIQARKRGGMVDNMIWGVYTNSYGRSFCISEECGGGGWKQDEMVFIAPQSGDGKNLQQWFKLDKLGKVSIDTFSIREVIDFETSIAGGECDETWNTPLTGNCDCNSIPNGNSVMDDCDVCGGLNADQDCTGECFGTSELDECGICGGNGFDDSCNDIEYSESPVPGLCCDCNGNVYDECGICGGYGIPEGECDCNGNVWINYYCDEDEDGLGCGDPTPMCGGEPTVTEDCPSWVTNDADPTGFCECSSNYYDECGICGGDGIISNACDCDGNILDECGICGGPGILDGYCDCNGNILDDCDVCGGGGKHQCYNGLFVCSESTCPDPLFGCMDDSACNYDSNVTDDNGSCYYSGDYCDCGASPLSGNISCDCNGIPINLYCDCVGTEPLTYCYDLDNDGNGGCINLPDNYDGECPAISCVSPGEGWTTNCNDVCDAGVIDCAGVCNGDSTIDECGICGGNGTLDDCGVCDGGNSSLDECGICFGTGKSTCWDGTQVCDYDDCSDIPIYGCTDADACNECTNGCNTENGTCYYPDAYCDCDGEHLTEVCSCKGIPMGLFCDCGGLLPMIVCPEYNDTGFGRVSEQEIICPEFDDENNNGIWNVGEPINLPAGYVNQCVTCPEGYDCNGECAGSSTIDECGVCGGNGLVGGQCPCPNNTLADCTGVCGGSAQLDECGVCDGTGAPANYNCDGVCTAGFDCEYTCGGDLELDECGVCDGPGISDGDCDCFGNVIDECGQCGGNGPNVQCHDGTFACNVVDEGDGYTFCPIPIWGCTDIEACNYNEVATNDNGGCYYTYNNDGIHDCGGICVNDIDEDGVCDELDGCTHGYDCCGECDGISVETPSGCSGGSADECGVCFGPGPSIQCWDESYVCDFSLCSTIPDVIQFGFPSIYIQGGLIRNFVGFTLPARDTLVCSGTTSPGTFDDECEEINDMCGGTGVCHYYDLSTVLKNSFFVDNPDLPQYENELPPLQSFGGDDFLSTTYDDGVNITQGNAAYVSYYEVWLGNYKILEPGRGYKLFTSNSGWIKWRYEE